MNAKNRASAKGAETGHFSRDLPLAALSPLITL
jgi:hypothetical protein